MTSSSSENDVLHSEADGSYDISFFASSVHHSLAFSQEVFEKLSGANFSSLAAVWRACTEDERRAYLLETHESAHHGLLFSTPAGVLLWRLNQVASRDIHYIGRKLRESGVSTPADRSPRKWLNSVDFRASVGDLSIRGGPSYLLYVIGELEKILKFRQIVFERQGPVVGQGMTAGEFIALANDVYSYLGDRCGLTVRGRWSTKRPVSSALFPENANFNLVDIAEVHAVAKELFVLRALRDLDGVAKRTSEFEEGPFGKCFRIAKRTAAMPNEIGFNPHAVQQLALLAFSTNVDLPQFEKGEHLIEEHLPWLVFCGEDSLSGMGIPRAFNSLVSQLSKPNNRIRQSLACLQTDRRRRHGGTRLQRS